MTEKSKVLKLVDICGEDCRRYSVSDMLKDTAEDIENGIVMCNKAIVLLLDDEDTCYEINYNAAETYQA